MCLLPHWGLLQKDTRLDSDVASCTYMKLS